MSNTVKKYLVIILALLCMACLTAVACKSAMYTINFETVAGVTIDSEVQSGYEVKKGYRVTFKLVLADGATGEAVVTANDETLTANSNGQYSFVMKADTTVRVTGIIAPDEYDVTFGVGVEVEDDDGNTSIALVRSEFVLFFDPDGNALSEIKMRAGEVIKFRVKLSVYYDGLAYRVAAGNSILSADADGYYTYTITGAVAISVRDLPETFDNTFLSREDGGKGTADDPFKIKTPLDLYAMADVISNTMNTSDTYRTAYYSLENDIDLRGEKLYIIGDATWEGSIFAGVFDGNNHTIKNFYMTDTLIEQSDFQQVHLPYIGLFGLAQASSARNAGIYNLNLKDYTINVNAAQGGATAFVGSIVGYGIGVDISNCSAEGKIVIDGHYNAFTYAGGLIGFQQSAYTSDNVRYYSVVQSCSSGVDITVMQGNVIAAGGITGNLNTYEENTTAAIFNCYSTGDIEGAIRAGGIVGWVTANGSVENCYATGYVGASSNILLMDNAEGYAYAYAGGIAGYVEYGAIISDCFFKGDCRASAVEGANYQFSDGIAAHTEPAGTAFIHTNGTLIRNCYSPEDHKVIDDAFIKTALGWEDADWKFNGDGTPDINREEAQKTYDITVMIGNTEVTKLTVENMYVPMTYWYALALTSEDGEGLNEFIGSGKNRTYGYYFDAELTQRVPNGFIPTRAVTLYAAYADYTEVTGDYYIEGTDGSYFTLDENGYLSYRDGARNSISTYIYDGDKLTLFNTFFAILADPENGFRTFFAELENGTIKIYDNDVYTESSPLTANAPVVNFKYGSYFDADGNEYLFNRNGTGTVTRGTNTVAFTFKVNESTLEITENNANVTGSVDADGVVTVYGTATLTRNDVLYGVWESSSLPTKSFKFNNDGTWNYEYYGYNSNGLKEVIGATQSGTYTVDGNTANLSSGVTATFLDGHIVIDGEHYYAENSFVGSWIYVASAPVIITFNGITADGYGTATVDYGSHGGKITDITYQAVVRNGRIDIEMYRFYEDFGLFSFNASDKTLSGELLILDSNSVNENVRLCKYDKLNGSWNFEGSTLNFNGLGYYDISKVVRGTIYDGARLVGTYYLTDATFVGTMTYNSVEYTITYNEENDTVTAVPVNGGDTVTLTRPAE